MAWRAVMIQNPTRLSLEKAQLALETEAGRFTIPLEDITVLILEHPQIIISAALLAECQEQGLAIVTCDKAHMPNGLLLPFLPHSRHSLVAKTQLAWAEPLRKRLWQKIVQTKILNQAFCLEAAVNKAESVHLRYLADQVKSGDPDNIEAQAARDYWQRLFGKGFKRGETNSINAALNYGYAIVRAYVARAQVAYGLLPAFGVHHDNALNAFNLTDDLMEVLRPTVDYRVLRMAREGLFDETETLTKAHRQQLATLGHAACTLDEKILTLAHTTDRMASSLVAAIEGTSPMLLKLPTLCVHETAENLHESD